MPDKTKTSAFQPIVVNALIDVGQGLFLKRSLEAHSFSALGAKAGNRVTLFNGEERTTPAGQAQIFMSFDMLAPGKEVRQLTAGLNKEEIEATFAIPFVTFENALFNPAMAGKVSPGSMAVTRTFNCPFLSFEDYANALSNMAFRHRPSPFPGIVDLFDVQVENASNWIWENRKSVLSQFFPQIQPSPPRHGDLKAQLAYAKAVFSIRL